MTIDIEQTTEEKPNKNREKLIRWFSIIFIVAAIAILMYYKNENPDFQLKTTIIIGVIILVLGAAGISGFNLYRWFEKRFHAKKDIDGEYLPEPASKELLFNKCKEAVMNPRYRDHIKKYISDKVYSIGKTKKVAVVEFKCETLYGKDKICHIIINAHYPDRMVAVMYDPSPQERREAINNISFDPEDSQDIEEIIRLEPTGTVVTHRKVTTPEKKKKKESKKEEDLM